MKDRFKNIQWKKWIQAGVFAGAAAVGVPELQAVLPKETLPYIQGALAAYALIHQYRSKQEEEVQKLQKQLQTEQPQPAK